MKYKIKGTLQINYSNNSLTFSIFPDSNFLCPENKNAILFPINKSKNAFIYPLNSNKSINFKKIANTNIEEVLIQLAIQNKHVELEISTQDQVKTVTGFTYPVR